MSTTKQKEAARKNIAKAREIQSERAHGVKIPRQTKGLSTAQQDKLPDNVFAFPKERKEPLTDAKHVRNAIARFDQVEGISDSEKDAAWKRIIKSAKKFDVDVHESTWRELGQISKSPSSKKTTAAKKTTAGSKTTSARKITAGSKTTSASKTTTGSKTSPANKTTSASKTSPAKKTTAARKTTSARKPVLVKK